MSDLHRSIPKQDVHTRDQIAQRAYELYEQRGGEHGRDLEDWLTAEKELRHQNLVRTQAAPVTAEKAAISSSRQKNARAKSASAFGNSAFDSSKSFDTHTNT